jgi:hypothetical protein
MAVLEGQGAPGVERDCCRLLLNLLFMAGQLDFAYPHCSGLVDEPLNALASCKRNVNGRASPWRLVAL